MGKEFQGPVERIDAYRWRIPRSYKDGMRVDGIVYASDELMASVREGNCLEQVANVACVPGIVGASLAMPDIHLGYGFCIGGVAATDPERGGVISPGGVGYDINCGVRLVRTDLRESEVRPVIKQLVAQIFRDVPAGVGAGGPFQFDRGELREIMRHGPTWLVDKKDIGTRRDVEHVEADGCLPGADPDHVSNRAFERGRNQCGTLGSGNHFVEVQLVDKVYDERAARAFGIEEGSITVMIHSGSRGLGHQVCDDYLDGIKSQMDGFGFRLPDRQLACAPLDSDIGLRYLGAMRAAANYAWCNRHMLMHEVRGAFAKVFGKSWRQLGMDLVYDVAHNIAKFEEHEVDGDKRMLCVHRKGATRAFPAGHEEVPATYREVGQPVLIPGDMGRCSYVLAGEPGAMTETFGSTCHGAGRLMSRSAAIRSAKNRSIGRELEDKGIIARSKSKKGLAEEQPDAYKNVEDVTRVVHEAGLSRRVCRMRPLGVTKG